MTRRTAFFLLLSAAGSACRQDAEPPIDPAAIQEHERTDDELVAAVTDRLRREGLADLHIKAANGVVILTGRVASDAARARAERVAMEAPGVLAVENRLQASGRESAP